MGKLSQKYPVLLKNSEVRVDKIRREVIHDFVHSFESGYMEYLFWDYSFGVKVVVGGQKINVGAFLISRINAHYINSTTVIDTNWWFGSNIGSDWIEMERELARALFIPEVPPLFFYYTTLDIAKQLGLHGPNWLVDFNISFEYTLKQQDFYLKNARVYAVGSYEEINPYDLGAIDFKSLALRVSRRLNYRIEFAFMIELAKWWFWVFKTAFAKFYDSLLETDAIKVLEKRKLGGKR